MANWLITGVSSGLGLALAQAALARGDHVAGAVRRAQDLAAFEALSPGRARGYILDLRDEGAVRSAVTAAETQLGGLDILVNNAGYGLIGAIEEASLDEIRAQFEVNVFGAVAVIQAALPYFRKRRAGHIINVTSVSGLTSWSGTGIYCASKFALEAIGQTLAQEVSGLGIRVTNVEPGGMRTDYAGRSLVKAQAVIADYDEGAHQAHDILVDHQGREPSSPAKVAQQILRIAGSDDPPLQLLLGSDAMHYATQRLADAQAEIGRWAGLTMATGVDEA